MTVKNSINKFNINKTINYISFQNEIIENRNNTTYAGMVTIQIFGQAQQYDCAKVELLP
jgi:hypothetical protein